MESGLTSWQIDGETMETVTEFILGGSKVTADDNCSHEIKRRLLLGRKAMTNLDSILKSRDHYFADKVPSSQSYDFSSSHVCIGEGNGNPLSTLAFKIPWTEEPGGLQSMGLRRVGHN